MGEDEEKIKDGMAILENLCFLCFAQTRQEANDDNMSIFEIVMLVCFGASWPLSIYRTWRVKSSHGKSLMFLSMIAVGYISGTIHKLLNDRDLVTLLYVMNGLMVSTDIALSAWYRRKNKTV